MDDFELCSDGTDIPVFAWRLTQRPGRNWGLHDLSDRLRMKGWLVPTYPLPDDLADELVQRVVVRNGFSHDLAHAFLDDLRCEVDHLNALTAPMPAITRQSGFHH